jgi:hypothetical protein
MFVMMLGLALSPAACHIEDSGNTNAAQGDTKGGEESPDPETIPDTTLAISGMVMRADNLEPVVGAVVTTEPSLGQVITNGEGKYVFIGDAATIIQLGQSYRVSATRTGYLTNFATVTVQEGHNRNVDIQLTEGKEELKIEANPVSLNYGPSSFTTGDTAFQQITLSLDNDSPAGTQQSFTIDVPIQHQAWLSVTPNSGTVGQTPMKLNVQVSKAGMGGATLLTGAFDVIAAGGLPLTIQVSVNLSGGNTGGNGGGETPAPDAGGGEGGDDATP